MGSLSELGIYIHTPFCKQKCAYCDFNSYAGLSELGEDYVKTLVREIKTVDREDTVARDVVSIYFGGGTPTLLSLSLLEQVLTACLMSFNVSTDAELTIEANPETLDFAKLKGLRRLGFNRLSLGFQSLNPRLLEILGRKHSAEEAVSSYHLARQTGFDNINIDLIFGIPTESLSDWKDTLKKAVELTSDHLSCYSLSVHKGTLLSRQIEKGGLKRVSEDEQAEMYEFTCSFLNFGSLKQYEISNFARPGCQCRHNLIYWKNGDYLGFGAGAHSHVNACRRANTDHPKRYIEMINRMGEATVSRRYNSGRIEQAETVFMNLRLNKGIDLDEFTERFGLSILDIYPGEIARLVDLKLATSDQRLKLTDKGRLLANDVMAEFV